MSAAGHNVPMVDINWPRGGTVAGLPHKLQRHLAERRRLRVIGENESPIHAVVAPSHGSIGALVEPACTLWRFGHGCVGNVPDRRIRPGSTGNLAVSRRDSLKCGAIVAKFPLCGHHR